MKSLAATTALAAAALLAGCDQHVESADFAAKLQGGQTCTVKFTHFRAQGSEAKCFGTLTLGDYAVRYDRNSHAWTGSGAMCGGGNQDHSDAGPDPTSGSLTIWGVNWPYDAKGNVLDKDGGVVGSISCKQ